MSKAEETLQEALGAFDFGAELVGAVRYGSGHVNDTFCVHTQPPEADCRRFIMQRLSSVAFARPDELMANMSGVTGYLRKLLKENGGDPDRETLNLLPTREGKDYYTDSENRVWRVTPFIENTRCLQAAETPELFYASAKAFGRFQKMLGGYPADTLYETIERFHDTESRFVNFKKALEANPLDRAKDAGPEIDFILARQKDCSVCMEALRQGKLPLRVTHNDTKLNNVLIDRTTGEGICVVDLDTVMPGLSINDFGDSIRFGANHSAEDEKNLSKVNLDLELFETYTRGFLSEAADTLTPAEIEYLPWGAKLMTLECGMRFLTDYLEGDRYFRTHYEGQNLIRCRTQLKLVADMEANWQAMKDIVAKHA